MKYFKLIVILLLVPNCSSKKSVLQNRSLPTTFIFKEVLVNTTEGLTNLKSMQDSILFDINSLSGKDSLIISEFSNEILSYLVMPKAETRIYVEIKNDTLWRYNKENGKMVGDYLMVPKYNGVLHYFDRTKTINYRKYDLFKGMDEYEVLEDTTDRKEIMGFDCHKLKLIKKYNQSDLGNTIYEMYVTQEIDAPLHSVINLGKYVPHTFPMEITISEENLPGLTERYEIFDMK